MQTGDELPITTPASISDSDSFTGTGKALNLTHLAIREENEIPISFYNGTGAEHNVTLGEGWVGEKISMDITNLRDERNWVNGSFDYGISDGLNNSDQVTDWDFERYSSQNSMTGHYYDESQEGKNCLELRMDISGSYYYAGSYCRWFNTFNVERGLISDAVLEFAVKEKHSANFNAWNLKVEINDVEVYTIGLISIKQLASDAWWTFTLPMYLWSNSTPVFDPQVPQEQNNISFIFEFGPTTNVQFGSFTEIDYQQILLADVNLNLSAQVSPNLVNLTMNGEKVTGGTGSGTVTQESEWENGVVAQFAVENNASYRVEFDTNITVWANKSSPTSNYEPKETSLGAKFTAVNDSAVEWEFYCFTAVPSGYIETNISLDYPDDWTINWVSTPQNPSVSVDGSCIIPYLGRLEIPVGILTSSPDGFWKFLATSPNYLSNISIYRNTTITEPGSTDWYYSREFLSGDWINITADFSTNPALNFSDYGLTYAQLDIKFPNKTIWVSQHQWVAISGNQVRFGKIQVPTSGGDYKVGDYKIFVTWNNSFGAFQGNETGIFLTDITVKHYSTLIPDDPVIESLHEGNTIGIYISYLDEVTLTAIDWATVELVNITGGTQTFDRSSEGYYYVEVTAPPSHHGDNLLHISASHPLYNTTYTTIPITVILDTRLDVEEYPSVTVPWNENFTLHCNYSEFTSFSGISDGLLQVDWTGGYYYIENKGNGYYDINVSTEYTLANQIQTIEVSVDDYGYTASSKLIEVVVNLRETEFDLLLNGTDATLSKEIQVPVQDYLNVSIGYYDKISTAIMGDGLINIGVASTAYSHSVASGRHQVILNTSRLGLGIHTVIFTLSKQNYTQVTFPVEFTILSRTSALQVLFNGTSHDPADLFSVPINSILNITVAFKDPVTGVLVQNPDIQIDGIETSVYEKSGNTIWTQFLVNTGKFQLGNTYMTLLGEKTNFQQVTALLQVKISPMRGRLSTPEKEQVFNIDKGDSFDLEILVENADLGGTITGCNVSYSVGSRTGTLKDPDGDGEYSTILSDLPVGTHVVTISVYRGPEYLFEEYQITITVIETEAGGLPTWIIYLFILAIVIVASLFIAYQTHFKYPKRVRDIRALKKKIKKDHVMEVSTAPKEKLFLEKYVDEAKSQLESSRVKELRGQYGEEASAPIEPREIPKDMKSEPSSSSKTETPEGPGEKPSLKTVEMGPIFQDTAMVGSSSNQKPVPAPKLEKPSPKAPLEKKGPDIPKIKPLGERPTVKKLPTKKEEEKK